MWSIFAPGKNPCAPNTDLNDCGWRPAKRPVRVGKVAESDTCEVESYAFTVKAPNLAEDPVKDQYNALCSDFSDDLLHAPRPAPARFCQFQSKGRAVRSWHASERVPQGGRNDDDDPVFGKLRMRNLSLSAMATRPPVHWHGSRR